AWIAAAVIGAAGPPGKSGAGESISLDLAVVDDAGTPAARLAERFAQQVATLSHGSMRVTVRDPETGPKTPRARVSTNTIRAVRAGGTELGLVPSWAFDAEGVRSLAPLQAPFQLMTVAQADQVAESPVADALQAGLGDIGLTGVGLLPESPERV